MRIRFHIRMAVLSKLSRACLYLGVLVFVSTLICMGSPLNLSEFSPRSFVQFFLWVMAFPLLTFFAGLDSILNFSDYSFWKFFASDSMQMISIGFLALVCLVCYWAFCRYLVLKIWGADWVRAATTIVRCFIFWGIFQLICAFIAFAWVAGQFKLGKGSPQEEAKQNPPSEQVSRAF